MRMKMKKNGDGSDIVMIMLMIIAVYVIYFIDPFTLNMTPWAFDVWQLFKTVFKSTSAG